MQVTFNVRPQGTGRATCKLCDKIIEVHQAQVTATGHQCQGSAHLECLLKMARGEKIKKLNQDAENVV